MEGADESTELWRHQKQKRSAFDLFVMSNQGKMYEKFAVGIAIISER